MYCDKYVYEFIVIMSSLIPGGEEQVGGRGRREREETRKRVREGERKTMTGDRIANDGYKGAGLRVV